MSFPIKEIQPKMKSCLNALKANFCAKPKKATDYEYVSYEPKVDQAALKPLEIEIPTEPSFPDQYEEISQAYSPIIKNLPAKSGLPQSVTPDSLREQIIRENLAKLRKQRELANYVASDRNTNYQMESSINNMSKDMIEQSSTHLSQFPMLIASPEVQRNCSLESTTNRTFNDIDQNPSPIRRICSDDEPIFEIIDSQTYSLYAKYTNSTPENGTLIDSSIDFYERRDLTNRQQSQSNNYNADRCNDQLYVCHLAYGAQSSNEINLRFSERVKLISTTNDLALVETTCNNLRGYVSKSCIMPLSQFLSFLSQLD